VCYTFPTDGGEAESDAEADAAAAAAAGGQAAHSNGARPGASQTSFSAAGAARAWRMTARAAAAAANTTVTFCVTSGDAAPAGQAEAFRDASPLGSHATVYYRTDDPAGTASVARVPRGETELVLGVFLAILALLTVCCTSVFFGTRKIKPRGERSSKSYDEAAERRRLAVMTGDTDDDDDDGGSSDDDGDLALRRFRSSNTAPVTGLVQQLKGPATLSSSSSGSDSGADSAGSGKGGNKNNNERPLRRRGRRGRGAQRGSTGGTSKGKAGRNDGNGEISNDDGDCNDDDDDDDDDAEAEGSKRLVSPRMRRERERAALAPKNKDTIASPRKQRKQEKLETLEKRRHRQGKSGQDNCNDNDNFNINNINNNSNDNDDDDDDESELRDLLNPPRQQASNSADPRSTTAGVPGSTAPALLPGPQSSSKPHPEYVGAAAGTKLAAAAATTTATPPPPRRLPRDPRVMAAVRVTPGSTNAALPLLRRGSSRESLSPTSSSVSADPVLDQVLLGAALASPVLPRHKVNRDGTSAVESPVRDDPEPLRSSPPIASLVANSDRALASSPQPQPRTDSQRVVDGAMTPGQSRGNSKADSDDGEGDAAEDEGGEVGEGVATTSTTHQGMSSGGATAEANGDGNAASLEATRASGGTQRSSPPPPRKEPTEAWGAAAPNGAGPPAAGSGRGGGNKTRGRSARRGPTRQTLPIEGGESSPMIIGTANAIIGSEVDVSPSLEGDSREGSPAMAFRDGGSV
jgi:hypothetical protein